ncbi:hypothetical protein QS795_005055 [Providencia zhijiangensis]|uniref:Sel1 repeat-containing protein n=1 Tax=Providencia zhijiangensis TaxID=3053982 RepID=A0ABZ0N4B9_9GAMM|nr:hypothetical protein [Providencia sp. D4759]WPA93138.1 hypothetical protein QS795_005055 [Providencia sp. D4759]
MIRNFTLIIFMLFLCACHGSNDVNKNNIIENSNSYGEYQNKEPSRFLIALQFMYFSEFKKSSSLMKNYDYKKQDYRKIVYDFISLNKKCFDDGIGYKEASKLYYFSLDKFNIPHDAWFFSHIFNALDEKDSEIIWKGYLYAINKGGRNEETAVLMKIWYSMIREATNSSSEKQKDSIAWLSIVRKMPVMNSIENTISEIWTKAILTNIMEGE